MHDQMLGLAGGDLFLWIAVAVRRFVNGDHFISLKGNCNIFRNFLASSPFRSVDMYLKQIQIMNTGPIGDFDYSFKFKDDGAPKPLILVGKNGSGKSIVLSHIVHSMLFLQSEVYADSDMVKGKAFKLRSPLYIKSDKNFLFSSVSYNNDLFYSEILFDRGKLEFEQKVGFPELEFPWNGIKDNEWSGIHSNLQIKRQEVENSFFKSVQLFFPPNRFEEPAWMNSENLSNAITYAHRKRLHGISERSIIKYNPMKENQNWMLDLFFDLKINQMKDDNIGGFIVRPVDGSFLGAVQAIIGRVLRVSPDFKWYIHDRGNRKISVLSDGKHVSNNLFALSTGESLLLNMFLSILRDFDMAMSGSAQFSDIEGVVVVDEIDLHLHSDLQHSVLPELIAVFPKIQFIITTHSPLFLMGMKKEFGADGMDVLNMPDGQPVDVETFSEFENVYNVFKESEKFLADKRLAVNESHNPVLFVEGSTDQKYFERASVLLGRESLLNRFNIFDCEGVGNLNKIWTNFKIGSKGFHNTVVLLYDCDTKKKLDEQGHGSADRLFKRTVPEMPNRLISKGIENLFSDDFIRQANETNPSFFDIEEARAKSCGGAQVMISEKWDVNEDAKSKLCDWIIANGTPSDFEDFRQVFDMLEKILNQANPAQATPAP